VGGGSSLAALYCRRLRLWSTATGKVKDREYAYRATVSGHGACGNRKTIRLKSSWQVRNEQPSIQKDSPIGYILQYTYDIN